MTVVSQFSCALPRGPASIIAAPTAAEEIYSEVAGPLHLLPEPAAFQGLATIVIEHRALVRDCLARCLAVSGLAGSFAAFASVDDWLAAMPAQLASLVLLCVGDRKAPDVERDLCLLSTIDAKVVLMAEDEDATLILAALDRGIKGYIPTSVPFGVAVEAMRLVCAGGIYVPASCLTNGRALARSETPKPTSETLFTSKQLSVVQALRQGKSNKVIAYELDMAESTVKVHVRNVMRKLKAHNRTEVAFLVNRMDALAE